MPKRKTKQKIWQKFKNFYERHLEKISHPIGWRRFKANNPALVEYLKPYKTPQQLTHKLTVQGLSISPSDSAEQVIFKHNYYRFKAYFLPFLDQTTDTFHAGTTFSEIYQLYLADQSIRDFLFPLVGQLEVRIRAILDNVLTSITQDPFWHLNPDLFTNYFEVTRALNKAGGRFSAGRQEFAIHYKSKYFNTKSFRHKLIPPFWILSEIFTMEQLLSVAKNLNKKKFAVSAGVNKLNECATHLGFNSYDSLITNIKCLLELRNICAHHSRLWNKNLQNPAAVNSQISIKGGKPNRLYLHLVMLRIMCTAQGIDDGIKAYFSPLIAMTPILKRDMSSMGFPNGWETDPFWN